MDTNVGYIAVQRFDPDRGPDWESFVRWSQLHQLADVVTIDCALCPQVIKNYTDDDWKHASPPAPGRTGDFGVFNDYDYLRQRVGDRKDVRILAVQREPDRDCSQLALPGFAFRGYDLVEDQTWISALLNCGGFDLAFQPGELSTCGLITEYARARAVQQALRTHYPDEHHAHCDLWAYWTPTR